MVVMLWWVHSVVVRLWWMNVPNPPRKFPRLGNSSLVLLGCPSDRYDLGTTVLVGLVQHGDRSLSVSVPVSVVRIRFLESVVLASSKYETGCEEL